MHYVLGFAYTELIADTAPIVIVHTPYLHWILSLHYVPFQDDRYRDARPTHLFEMPNGIS